MMRLSWRRKKRVEMAVHDMASAQAFINLNFTDEGEYRGDNPYLAHSSVGDMLMRWRNAGAISADDYSLLRRANLDHVATVIITRKDGGYLFADDDDQRHFCEVAAYIPQDADVAMTLMQRVAVAEQMELQPQKAIVYLRLYEGTAIHCAEYLCKFYAYHLRLRYHLEGDGDLLKYEIK